MPNLSLRNVNVNKLIPDKLIYVSEMVSEIETHLLGIAIDAKVNANTDQSHVVLNIKMASRLTDAITGLPDYTMYIIANINFKLVHPTIDLSFYSMDYNTEIILDKMGVFRIKPENSTTFKGSASESVLKSLFTSLYPVYRNKQNTLYNKYNIPCKNPSFIQSRVYLRTNIRVRPQYMSGYNLYNHYSSKSGTLSHTYASLYSFIIRNLFMRYNGKHAFKKLPIIETEFDKIFHEQELKDLDAMIDKIENELNLIDDYHSSIFGDGEMKLVY